MDEIEALRTFRQRRADEPVPSSSRREALAGALATTQLKRRAALGRSRPRRRWVISLASVVAAGTACAMAILQSPEASRHVQSSRTIIADGLTRWATDTAADVVSWADQVSIVTAVSAVDVPDLAPPEEGDAGEGLINRRVSIRIDQTVWHRDGAPEIAGTLTIGASGWAVSNDHPKSRFVLRGSSWIELNTQYLMPLALDEGSWRPIMYGAAFPYTESGVMPTDGQNSALARQLTKLQTPDIVALFAAARPDPEIAKHFDLRPSDRVCALMEDRGTLTADECPGWESTTK